MKEYRIYCRWNGGAPFIEGVYKSIGDVKARLLNMIALEEERERIYYIDNDFFDNKHSLVGRLKYFRVEVRDVSSWSPYYEELSQSSSGGKILSLNELKYKSF